MLESNPPRVGSERTTLRISQRREARHLAADAAFTLRRIAYLAEQAARAVEAGDARTIVARLREMLAVGDECALQIAGAALAAGASHGDIADALGMDDLTAGDRSGPLTAAP